jgi:hypothetical protein
MDLSENINGMSDIQFWRWLKPKHTAPSLATQAESASFRIKRDIVGKLISGTARMKATFRAIPLTLATFADFAPCVFPSDAGIIAVPY